MQSIIVDKVNDVYIRIDADQSLSRELSDYFSFEVKIINLHLNLETEFGMARYDYFHMQQVKCMLDCIPYLKDWCNKKSIHIVESSDILTHSTHTGTYRCIDRHLRYIYHT